MSSRFTRRIVLLAGLLLPATVHAQADTALHPVLLATARVARPAALPTAWHAEGPTPAFVFNPTGRSREQAEAIAKVLGIPVATAPVKAGATQPMISIATPSIQQDTARVGVEWFAAGWMHTMEGKPGTARTCIFVFSRPEGAWKVERTLCSAK